MMRLQLITILKVVVVLMLSRALADNPYSYYQMIRWIVTAVAAYSAFLAYGKELITWVWIMSIIAIVFNPIIPFYLARETWAVIDVLAALLFAASIFKMDELPKKKTD